MRDEADSGVWHAAGDCDDERAIEADSGSAIVLLQVEARHLFGRVDGTVNISKWGFLESERLFCPETGGSLTKKREAHPSRRDVDADTARGAQAR